MVWSRAGPGRCSVACVSAGDIQDSEAEGGDIVVDVIDRGPGVPDGVKTRIFDKFYRGKEAGSAGLGLTIAQQIVQAHRGNITVRDTPGGGATFHVSLVAVEDEDDEVLDAHEAQA